ncbi:helix-turn-helix domain-containing protein [Streptomyces griseosporeus]|uniref:helix-turn-helix domain-containing protein n=1 Tax=Streptomyces griseosporeus TaxID=1910 RepID=UPI0036FD5105
MSLPSGHIQVLTALPATGNGRYLYLGRVLGASTATSRDGEEIRLGRSDLVFCDPTRPRSLRFDGACEMTVFRISRQRLALSDEDLDRVTGMAVRGDSGLGGLVSNVLVTLTNEADAHGADVIGRLTRSAVDLIIVLMMELLQSGTDMSASLTTPGGRDMLHQIKAYIDEHLTDPDLSPRTIARAHHISVRYLHKLFQSHGATVGTWVRQRRLDSCRTDLSLTFNRNTTVAAVARRWGFSSPAHFSRSFKEAYGMTPREWQSLAAS